MDWADEQAKVLLRDAVTLSPSKLSLKHQVIATALRKAKADGMREAAEYLLTAYKRGYRSGDMSNAIEPQFNADEIRARANAIEKGTG